MKNKIEEYIKEWVEDYFGEGELNDPSWDIGGLSRWIAERLEEGEA